MVKIILHCSDSPYGNASLITKWHVLPKPAGNGWENIGYHYVILNGWLDRKHVNMKFNGHIETGRPLDEDHIITADETGAHVAGQNKNSVGICLIGKSGKFTEEQLNSALAIVYQLEKQFVNIQLHQHSDFDEKKPYCAGIDMEKFKKNYAIYKGMMREGDLIV